MARKRDRDDPDIVGTDISVADIDNDVTEEVLRVTADRESGDRAIRERYHASGTEPEHAPLLQSADDETLQPGFVLRDRFQIVELVHSGGMGHVYKAIDRRRRLHGSDQIYVAIKMTRRSVVPEANAAVVLEREAAKAQRLSHPNIVNIYDFDLHDDQFYLVMEWLEGESVKELLKRTKGRRLAPQFVWQIIQGVASGLQHAHSNNVVHADINPSNIFITDTQQIKLLDFGVARYSNDLEGTKDGEFVWVTRKYASPDVLSGSPVVFEDDIFSLACVAYRLLSGKHPFSGLNSMEAEKAGVTAQPVPGLSEAQWRTLGCALSFSRSDRPNTVSAFFGDVPVPPSIEFIAREGDRRPADWRLFVAAAAIALTAGLWWSSKNGVQDQPTAIPEPPPVKIEINPATATPTAPPELAQLLSNATQAMDDQRYTEPEDDNARALYRDVLALQPGNSTALSGLRTISDIYVRRANAALSADAPEEVVVALSVAADTDPDNPAVGIVNDLLLAQGNARLADARLAIAKGDDGRAARLLSEAERYRPVDVNEITAVRLLIEQSIEERQFLRKLSAVDAHISAGRLMAPEGNNAHALLLELRRNHDGDARVQASMERLGERLLAQAALASAAGRVPEAKEYLTAADALGVMTVEITAARRSLLSDSEGALEATVAAIGPRPGSIKPDSAPGTESAVDNAATRRVPAEASTTDISRAAAATEALVAASVMSDARAKTLDSDSGEISGTTTTDEPRQQQRSSLSDLEIEKYVAPIYPRRARRRGVTGSVELRFTIFPDGSTGTIEILDSEPGTVFVASVEKAVKQWRFAPRDDEHKARLTLRFE